MQQLFYNANLLTMDENQTGSAVLVQDGIIKEVGDEERLRAAAGNNCELIDCGGMTLMPSFIDSHSHLTALAQTLSFCDLSEAKSFGDIAGLLKAFAKERKIKQGDFLIGFGYDHNSLAEQQHPDRTLLDNISREIAEEISSGKSSGNTSENFPGNNKEIPIAITHASGHMGVLNSAALDYAGIDSAMPDPEGGRIGRDKDGKPNGYLEETAFIGTTAKFPAPSKEQIMKNIELAQRIYLSYGITTIQDGMTKSHDWEILKEMAEQGRLKADVVCYADLQNDRSLAADNREYSEGFRNNLRLGGYKIFLDGSPQGRTAWLTKPYEGETDYCGYPVHSDEQVREFVRQAVEDKKQILAHCNGDAAAEQYISCCEEVGGTSAVRPVMIHAQTVRPDQLERMAEIGMMPSYFVAHVYHWGDVHIENLGKERADNISPLKSTVDAGLPFTLHQDSPVIPPDMLETVWCAVNRTTKDGQTLGSGQRITVYEALKAVTLNAAYQYFEENQKGSITPGKFADLVLLSQNPLAVPSDKLREIKVMAVFKKGTRVY